MLISAQNWATIYTVSLIIPSLALGATAVHMPRHLGGTRVSRFLIGFATTPFLIALWTLVLSVVSPGAPRFLFYLTPSIISIVPLILYGRRTLRRLFREWWRARRTCVNPVPIYFSYVCAAVLATSVLSTLAANAKAQFINHDVLAHLSVALPFAEARSASAIPDFTATIDEPTMSQSHTYLYPAFLANALMTTGSETLGYPNDYAARAAIQIMIVYLLISVVALAATSGQMGAGPLALMLLLPALAIRMSFNCHRMPFQLIPLVLLAAVLSEIPARRLRRRLKPGYLVPCAMFAGFSVAAHTINIVILPLVVAAWLVWMLLERAPLLRIAYVLVAVGIGTGIAGLHYLKSYIDTGSPMGYGFIHYAYVGTPLWDAWQRARGFDAIRGVTLVRRFGIAFRGTFVTFFIPGMAALLLAFGQWLKNKQWKSSGRNLFMGLVALIGLLPLAGLADFGMVRISDMFIINTRYIQFWYPFAVICVGTIILQSNQRDLQREKSGLQIAGALFFILFFGVGIIYALRIPAVAVDYVKFYGPHLVPFVALALVPSLIRLEKRYQWLDKRRLPSYAAPVFILLLIVLICASLWVLVFIINPHHWLFFLGAFLLIFFPRPAGNSREPERHMAMTYIGPVLIVFFFLVTITTWRAVDKWWVSGVGEASIYEKSIQRRIQEIMAISKSLPSQYKVLHDHRGVDYYLSNPSVFMFSHPAWGIVRAKDESELRSLLADANIRYILLDRPFKYFWGETVMFTFLNNPRNASLIEATSKWRFYEVIPHESEKLSPENQSNESTQEGMSHTENAG